MYTYYKILPNHHTYLIYLTYGMYVYIYIYISIMSLGVLVILIYNKEIMIDAKFSICYLAITFASKADTREMEIGLSDVGKSLGRQRYGLYGCKI